MEILWLVTSLDLEKVMWRLTGRVAKGLGASVFYVGGASLCGSLSYSSI